MKSAPKETSYLRPAYLDSTTPYLASSPQFKTNDVTARKSPKSVTSNPIVASSPSRVQRATAEGISPLRPLSPTSRLAARVRDLESALRDAQDNERALNRLLVLKRDDVSRIEVASLSLEKRLAAATARLRVLETENLSLRARVCASLGIGSASIGSGARAGSPQGAFSALGQGDSENNAIRAAQQSLFALQVAQEEQLQKHAQEVAEKDRRIEQLQRLLALRGGGLHDDNDEDDDADDEAVSHSGGGDFGAIGGDHVVSGEFIAQRSDAGGDGATNPLALSVEVRSNGTNNSFSNLNNASGTNTPAHGGGADGGHAALVSPSSAGAADALQRKQSFGRRRKSFASLSALTVEDQLAVMCEEDQRGALELIAIIRAKYDEMRLSLVPQLPQSVAQQ